MQFKSKLKFAFFLSAVTCSLLAGTEALGQVSAADCGPLKITGKIGPFDYRNQRQQLELVEPFHFPPETEALLRGSRGSTSIGGNIAFTLHVFPNHHRALIAMMRYGEKTKTTKPEGSPLPVECWFERALRFRPDDTTARLIYATFLAKNARTAEAVSQLEQTTKQARDEAFTHYNIGLVYFDLKDYEKANQQAQKAIALGFSMTALRDQLQSVGKWTPPPEQAPAAAIQSPNQ